MKQLIELMLQIPTTMARIGVEQVQSVMQGRDGSFEEAGREWQLDDLRSDAARHAEDDDFGQVSENSISSPHQTAETYVVERPADVLPHDHVANSPIDFGRLDVSTMVVVGESLASGVGDFTHSTRRQRVSFVQQLADHLGTELPAPLFQEPGISLVDGGATHLPQLEQTTGLANWPPSRYQNLSIPELTLAEALKLRGSTPVFQGGSAKQTIANLVLSSFSTSKSSPTLIEAAIARRPSFTIVALGLSDLLQPALSGRLKDVPSVGQMEDMFGKLLRALQRADSESLVLNIPNPLDMPCFSSLSSAGRVLRVSSSSLQRLYGLGAHDRLTVDGILEIGVQVNRRDISALQSQHVLREMDARAIERWVADVNKKLARVVEKIPRTELCDISSSFAAIAMDGVFAESRQLTADYLGGIYGLNGYSMGAVGHVVIANEVIRSLNENYDASIPSMDYSHVLARDTVAAFRSAAGPKWSEDELDAMRVSSRESSGEATSAVKYVPPRPMSMERLARTYNATYRDAPSERLRLPPTGQQILPLNRTTSYHSDAMRVVNCSPEQGQWGSCGDDVFDGLAMFGGQLVGSLHFEFSPPRNDIAKFTVRIVDVLLANDGVLSTPGFMRFPLLKSRVTQPRDLVSSGEVNLVTGEVSNLDLFFVFSNSGLAALQSMNPTSFPQPAIIRYKQQPKPDEGYGTAWARFMQREDGQLDFLFHGTAFVPMGPGFRFALPISGPAGDFATVPANGTQLHPHLHLSTVDAEKSTRAESTHGNGKAWLPTNSVRELVANSANTSFGDDFTLNHPDFGIAYGRSHLAGRIMLQFGERFGELAPFCVRMLPPAGSVDSRSLSPLQNVFPGRLRPGMTGHDAVLRFPSRQYRQNDLYLIDDPFELAVGAVDVFTGEVVGDFLHRGFLGQALFYALVRVEPRTPQGSFEYRGTAVFSLNEDGTLKYRFNGTMKIPYQEGFLWPLPDLANGVPVGADSRLDPFFQVDAVEPKTSLVARKQGAAKMQLAPTGDRFSYRYSISNRYNDICEFEYTNHTQQGTFRLTQISYVAFTGAGRSEPDTVTFSGFGRWSRDDSKRLRHASVQISTCVKQPYVSILVDGGQVSNVNTTVKNETPPLTQLADSNGKEIELP